MAKEVVLPVAAWPLCLWLRLRGAPGAGRRTMVVAAAQAVLGLAWLGFYVAGRHGSNAAAMLDPIHSPADYLAALPGRAIVLLSTWLIPLNPFVFRFHHGWEQGLIVYGIVGAVALAAVIANYRRSGRRDTKVLAMALWVVPFLPLLACTVPDDRIMILPSIGFAYLGAVWLTWPRADGSRRLRKVPLFLFIFSQAAFVPATFGTMQFMELEARRHLRLMAAAFGREEAEGDTIFFLNTARSFEGLLAQERLHCVQGRPTVRVSVLSDISRPRISVLDDRTLRLEAQDAPFFSSFLGMMGTRRDQPRREGDVIRGCGVDGLIAEVEGGEVVAIELRFRKPLESDSYRFFWSDAHGPPTVWQP